MSEHADTLFLVLLLRWSLKVSSDRLGADEFRVLNKL